MNAYSPPAVIDIADPHLADLLELKAIAAGAESEAYTAAVPVCAQTPHEPTAT